MVGDRVWVGTLVFVGVFVGGRVRVFVGVWEAVGEGPAVVGTVVLVGDGEGVSVNVG